MGKKNSNGSARHVRLDLPAEELGELRIAAARAGMSQAEFARRAVMAEARAVNQKGRAQEVKAVR